MLQLSRLRLLAELDRLGTIAAVAEALSYTPSAVSQQLAALERETRTVLLEKVGRGVRLTDAARALAEHARTAMAVLESAEAELAASRTEVTGVLRVTSFQTVLVSLAPATLSALARDHPNLDVRITQAEVEEAYEGLQSREFDIILGEEYPQHPEPRAAEIDRIDLLNDPLYIALPELGPWSRPRVLADLADAPWALDPAGSVMGEWTRHMCALAGFVPRVAFDAPDPLLHAHLVRSGLAVGFIPGLLGQEPLGRATLRPLAGAPERVLYTAVREASAAHPAVLAFRAAIAAAAAGVQAADSEQAPLRLR